MSFSYVVFTKCDHWIGKILHSDISHCYILKECRGRWIVSGKAINGYDLYTTDDYSDILSEGFVLKVKTKPLSRGLFMLNTCVGSVKQQLGIRKPFIWTPYQLYRYLHGRVTKEAAKDQ